MAKVNVRSVLRHPEVLWTWGLMGIIPWDVVYEVRCVKHIPIIGLLKETNKIVLA